jgi:hypothetical protein
MEGIAKAKSIFRNLGAFRGRRVPADAGALVGQSGPIPFVESKSERPPGFCQLFSQAISVRKVLTLFGQILSSICMQNSDRSSRIAARRWI